VQAGEKEEVMFRLMLIVFLISSCLGAAEFTAEDARKIAGPIAAQAHAKEIEAQKALYKKELKRALGLIKESAKVGLYVAQFKPLEFKYTLDLDVVDELKRRGFETTWGDNPKIWLISWRGNEQ
jgi:hypothetical protein